jgi:transposase
MMRTTVVVERAQLVARTRADGRHVYRKEGKAALIAACAQPGASVAAIALAHGVNANLLRKWITRSHMRDRAYRDQRTEASALGHAAARSPASMSTHAAQFLAVELAPASAPPAVPAPVISAPGTISIQIGEARIDIGGVVEREALRRVIDCLRESTDVASVSR